MRNATITTTKAREKEDRRRRVEIRYGQLKKTMGPKEAINVLAEEEARSPKTIYSILEGWR